MKGGPPILSLDTTCKEWQLISHDGSESRRVWAYEDDEGWHGRLMSEADDALPLTWTKASWRSV